MLHTKEHEDLIAQFERDCKKHIERTDKEPKSMWADSIIYQDGKTNALFLVYRNGYAYGKAIWRA